MSAFNDLLGLLLGPSREPRRGKKEEERLAALRARRTPEVVTELADDEVFVFGSNAAGQHGAGAARAAFENFGAEWGVGAGPTGRSYAIDTMSGFDTMLEQIVDFLEYAQAHPDTTFLVTPIGTGIAGHKAENVAPFFQAAPENVVLPQVFVDALDAQ
ncbi:hypothetical protein SK224_13420 [Microbacterium sp. BG28]|uniref:A1S_2505 family phage non-structural protein n=1 Tax=Microbacterium sp. BG28 TaxID=3097356 RepID=UPI002A5AD9AB|nr:hypothetical protein [Microbacterium sp. BG28]MDY0830127.1 hypothetical protein [Microbacterium sp. BG28]